jgi:DNA-binding CsgD family transcriptional regulator
LGSFFAFILFLFTPALEWLSGPVPDTGGAGAYVGSYAVLPDAGYSFITIRSNKTLPFVADDSLRPGQYRSHWLRLVVVNTASYDEPYVLSIEPALNNTVYTFDRNRGRWLMHQAGLDVPYSGRRNRAAVSIMARGNARTVVYARVDVHRLQPFGGAVKPQFLLEKQARVNRDEQYIVITWVASLAVLCLFFLNNLVIYVNLRDKIVFYYLIAQVGGIIYITNHKLFFNIMLPGRVFSMAMGPNGSIRYFDCSGMLDHLSILLILWGFVQLTRAYLQTSVTLPRFDLYLSCGLYSYMGLTLLILLVNTTYAYLGYYTIPIQNLHAFLLIGGILCTSIVGYVRKLPAAAPFLLANSLPLVFMIAIPLFHLFFPQYTTEEALMPDLAVVSQAFAFSIALVVRTKAMQAELTARTVEAQQLAFTMREVELQQQLTALENQQMAADIRHEKTRNQLLQERLDINQRELASTTLYIVQKNELLASLKAQLAKLDKHNPPGWHQELRSIESILQSNLYLDADWRKFKVHFEQIHPNFFEDLLAKHPTLTKHEIRLYAYFHINLSTKEIAALLNIDPASVRRAKTRLYKKMAAPGSGSQPGPMN